MAKLALTLEKASQLIPNCYQGSRKEGHEIGTGRTIESEISQTREMENRELSNPQYLSLSLYLA